MTHTATAAPAEPQSPVPTISRVARIVAADYGMSSCELLGAGKRHDMLEPRRVAMTIARRVTSASYARIGRRFGRDHSSVIAAIAALAAQAEASPDLAARIERLADQVRTA